jgi:hypothetical protein
MAAIESSGTQSATLTTEHTLGTSPTTGKTRVLLVDANALAAGETLTLRIKGKVLTGGTQRLIREAVFTGPLTEPHIQSMPVIQPFGGDFTLTQAGGTGRSFDWSIVVLD